jgi:hypothetical protein
MKKKKDNEKKKLHIAVVWKKGIYVSNRTHGDYASFIGTTQKEAIHSALQAKHKWENEDSYDIAVGELKFNVNDMKYTLEKL